MAVRLLRLSKLAVIFWISACAGVPSSGETSAIGGSVASGGSSALGGGSGNSMGGGGTGGTLGGASAGGSAASSVGGSVGCSGTPTLGTVSPAVLNQELSQPTRSFLLINVHTPLVGNIPGTDADIVYTNVSGIEQFIGSEKSKPVVIYCYSDHMATIAGPELVSDGYCNIRYLQGGLAAWQTAGYPVNPT